MADIKPFRAIRYSQPQHKDLSPVIAPPYDVLDDAAKKALLSRSPNNIVEVDLPHLPAKTVGPPEAYQRSAATLAKWLSQGVLVQDESEAIYAYTQTYSHRGREFKRRGFIALVKLEPFSTPTAPTSVVPHEKTYPDAIVDRLNLTRATGVQLSPIFGLFPDPEGKVNDALYAGVGEPECRGTLDGVTNEVWPVRDERTQQMVIGAIKSKKVYIADGHHRYTTALAYQKQQLEAHGGKLPLEHPANWCLFVLLSMHDPGCVILPTHRIVGSLKSFDLGTLREKLKDTFTIEEVPFGVDQIGAYEESLASEASNVFGLYDGKSKKLYTLRLTQPDVLRTLEPNQSDAWRSLDVAILRRYLLDEIIGPTFAGGEMKLAYTADATQVPAMTDGETYRIALLLRPTPLKALEDLGTHGEVMPQKSTYFYPKLATGVAINPVV